MSIAGDGEVRLLRRDQRERVGDAAAVHREMMARLVVGRRGTGVEVEAAQVESRIREPASIRPRLPGQVGRREGKALVDTSPELWDRMLNAPFFLTQDFVKPAS
jgi:hypothetical protein